MLSKGLEPLENLLASATEGRIDRRAILASCLPLLVVVASNQIVIWSSQLIYRESILWGVGGVLVAALFAALARVVSDLNRLVSAVERGQTVADSGE